MLNKINFLKDNMHSCTCTTSGYLYLKRNIKQTIKSCISHSFWEEEEATERLTEAIWEDQGRMVSPEAKREQDFKRGMEDQ